MSKFFLALFLIVVSAITNADDRASSAVTPGHGRIEIVSNYLLFSSGKNYDAKIPTRVQEGTRIKIQYKKDDQWVAAEFVVAGISTKGDLCRLHSELPSRHNTSASDTIYVKPCRYN